jgi:uncharacterized protein (UPF0335 family)
MNDLEESRINRLEIEVSAIKEKVSFFSVIYDKFDSTLEKLERMVEDRRNDTNQDLKEVYQKISTTEEKIMGEITSLRKDMQRQHEIEAKKIENLDKWRWLVVGGAIVVGWITSRLLTYFTFFDRSGH